MNLESTFAVLQPDQSVVPVPVTREIYQSLDRDFDGFKGRTLVSQYEFNADWPSWESHPAGDETVVLVSGEAQFVLEEGAGHRSVTLSRPGDCVIVPAATWHTARISQPTRLLFITPGEGTRHRPK